ncbi:MAG: hypothetical protein HYS80_02515 [Candidatus Aenigmarchaeota archaeon]|nr:hypothetical protein [Candidatus Aenigmarchaeota archaeon]
MMKGISFSIIIITIAVITVGIFYTTTQFTNQSTSNKVTNQNENIQTIVQPTSQPSSKTFTTSCEGRGTVAFTSSPRRLEDIEMIQPIGLINANSGHVTPTDHGYYYPPNWNPQNNPAEFRDVLSPANGAITTVQLVGGRRGDYRLIIHHTCTFYTIYIHIFELSPKITQAVGEMNVMTKNTNIPVSAGEVIGRSNSFDFSVHDDDVILKGFIVPEHYNGEPWKIHTVDMFAYFTEPIKSQLLAKNIKESEPRAGKIDYDIDGRLVGNWFVENTNGYSGLTHQGPNYWATHLSFAYDGIDPTLIMVSIGDYNGKSEQFAVKGNSPNPAAISMTDGIVKYELTDYDYTDGTGQFWNRVNYAKGVKAVGKNEVGGVALVQMIGDRKIKFEVFPSKTASEVSGFVNPTLYER